MHISQYTGKWTPLLLTQLFSLLTVTEYLSGNLEFKLDSNKILRAGENSWIQICKHVIKVISGTTQIQFESPLVNVENTTKFFNDNW